MLSQVSLWRVHCDLTKVSFHVECSRLVFFITIRTISMKLPPSETMSLRADPTPSVSRGKVLPGTVVFPFWRYSLSSSSKKQANLPLRLIHIPPPQTNSPRCFP